MTSRGLRFILLVGLVISTISGNVVMITPSAIMTLHHQPAPCGPDC
jgi:hypothetical protein